MAAFFGVKVALFFEGRLVVIQRDNKPGLYFAGMWDFAGGGRENQETPLQCVVREVQEELGITLDPSAITWQKTYPAMKDPNKIAYFMVAELLPEQFHAIHFGDEGQGWKLMTIDEFMQDRTAIEALKARLKDYLESMRSGTSD